MSHCTDCHTLGARVSNEKCLDCHIDLKSRIEQQKGYHSSSQITGKECSSCHNEHHGRNFRIINFDPQGFDHSLTGYELLGAHRKKECKNCHKPEFIGDPKIRSKDFTFLGLETECLSCHDDYHQKTLSGRCLDCHGMDAFKPAGKFDHSKARFPLLGKHREVDCLECHEIRMTEGVKFQEFAGIGFANCTNCHKDVHQNKFGQNCRDCHTEESFHVIKGMTAFDHNRTDFPLQDKHREVSCKSCHKTKLTDPLKHGRCSDCHSDYHRGQFAREGITPDCSSCHDTRGFSLFDFTLERHNSGRFPLTGAHVATPCFVCHMKEEKWSFREIGIRCADCHRDIHEGFISEKYYLEKDCKKCHHTGQWSEVTFEHALTGFLLKGGHTKPDCRDCHFHESEEGRIIQEFKGQSAACASCHADIHFSQFAREGSTSCERCHDVERWKPTRFDHDSSRFILDGKHKDVACKQCHKPVVAAGYTYVQYKFDDIRCEACHR